MFQCTWPKCGKISSTCTDIEKHVRNKHLGVKESSTDSDSEHEEEFYYTEIEVNVENVTQGLSDMSTSSPSSPPERLYITDHDYQKKDYRQVYGSSVPSGGYINNLGTATVAISIPQIKRSLSWQNTYTFSSSPSPPIRPSPRPSPQERLQQHQAQSPKNHMLSMIPKTGGSHKKPRSEVRKCRKVYGMENRDMWCTQCKWKKACTRFLDWGASKAWSFLRHIFRTWNGMDDIFYILLVTICYKSLESHSFRKEFSPIKGRWISADPRLFNFMFPLGTKLRRSLSVSKWQIDQSTYFWTLICLKNKIM